MSKNPEAPTGMRWQDITLTAREEAEEEELCRETNILLLRECLTDAKTLLEEESLDKYDTNLVRVAIALFDKRASHVHYWKLRRSKDKALN